jgi:tetratricopeptide (TPR) repeat protein
MKILLILLLLFSFTSAQTLEIEPFTDPTINDQMIHSFLAASLSQQAYALMDKADRTENEDYSMLYYALGARYHRLHQSEQTIATEQKSLYLIGRVYCALNKPLRALQYATACLDLTKKHYIRGIDRAFAFELMARAQAANGDRVLFLGAFNEAKQIADESKELEKQEKFFLELRKEPWFEQELPDF